MDPNRTQWVLYFMGDAGSVPLGWLIGGLVVAMYLPIFQLGSVVTGGH